jgi:hypothetical protein
MKKMEKLLTIKEKELLEKFLVIKKKEVKLTSKHKKLIKEIKKAQPYNFKERNLSFWDIGKVFLAREGKLNDPNIKHDFLGSGYIYLLLALLLKEKDIFYSRFVSRNENNFLSCFNHFFNLLTYFRFLNSFYLWAILSCWLVETKPIKGFYEYFTFFINLFTL